MRIETDRIIIRRFTAADTEDLYDYLSKEAVVKYEPYPPYTREMAEETAKNRAADGRFYAVALKEGKVIGNLYLAGGEFDTWELGYVFHDDFWGQGYAYESTRALLNYSFARYAARRITAMCNPLNEASWKLLERLGFRREGELIKNVCFFKDAAGNPIWQDTYEYGLLREEWREIS